MGNLMSLYAVLVLFLTGNECNVYPSLCKVLVTYKVVITESKQCSLLKTDSVAGAVNRT